MKPLEGWELPDHGVLFVVSGPSGVGKSTLVKRALQRIPGLRFSVSATTRAPRPGEIEGVDYRFVTQEQFAALVEEGAFLEHAAVYGRSYGTLRAPTEAVLASGESILLDVDVKGSKEIRRQMPDAVHVFLLPPSLEELESRLRARNADDDAIIVKRMRLAHTQLRGSRSYDYVVVNDNLDTADAVFQGILLAELTRTSRRGRAIRRVRGDLHRFLRSRRIRKVIWPQRSV